MTFLRFCDPHLMAVPSHGGDGDPQFQTSQYFALHIGSSEKKHLFFRAVALAFIPRHIIVIVHSSTPKHHIVAWQTKLYKEGVSDMEKKDVAFNTWHDFSLWDSKLTLFGGCKVGAFWDFPQTHCVTCFKRCSKCGNFLISWSFRLWREQWDLGKKYGLPLTLANSCSRDLANPPAALDQLPKNGSNLHFWKKWWMWLRSNNLIHIAIRTYSY